MSPLQSVWPHQWSSQGCGGRDMPQVRTYCCTRYDSTQDETPRDDFLVATFYFLLLISIVDFLQGEESTLIINTSATKIVAVGNISSRSFEDILRYFWDISNDTSIGVCLHPTLPVVEKKRLGNSFEGVWYHAIMPCVLSPVWCYTVMHCVEVSWMRAAWYESYILLRAPDTIPMHDWEDAPDTRYQVHFFLLWLLGVGQ